MPTRVKSQVVRLLAALALFVAAAANWRRCPAQDAAAANTAPRIDFVREVRPILAEHCYACHGAKKQEGGLRLDRKAAALQGGDNYAPAIVPGKSGASPLWKFVARSDADLQMPPEGERLSAAQVNVLKRWIDEGAAWPEDVNVAGDLHWSFRPVARPALPTVDRAASTFTGIDRFILARLKREHLQFSPQADRVAICRRLYFDLVGLPPSPEEVAAFAADES